MSETPEPKIDKRGLPRANPECPHRTWGEHNACWLCKIEPGRCYDLCKPGVRAMHAELARLQAELAKWPRVYWNSADPKSTTEGFRVLSVEGHIDCDCKDSWMSVDVDSDDGEIGAPTDFGLYSSSEDAKAAKEKT